MVADVKLVQRVIEAYNSGDVDAIARLYHPDVTIIPTPQFAPPGTVYHGHEGFRCVSADVSARFASIRIDPQAIRRVNRRVLTKWTSIERLQGASASVSREAIHLITCENGLVRRVEGFLTEEQALAAAQLQDPVAVANRYIDACLRGDAEAAAAECHPDVLLFPSPALLPAGTAYTGHDGVRSMLSNIAQWSYYVVRSRDVREKARRVVVSMVVMRGTSERDAVLRSVEMLMAFEHDKIRLVESSSTAEAAKM